MFRGRSVFLVLTLLAVSLFAVGPAAGFGQRVFNANPTISGSGYPVDKTVIIVITTTHGAAQSFAPNETFVLWNVTLYVTNVGGQTDTLNVTIQGDSGGRPDGTALAESDQVGSGTRWLDFPMATRPTLIVGRTYWIVAENGAQQGYTWVHSSSNRVAGQSVKSTNGTWGTPTDIDLTYVTYGVRLEPKISVGLAVDRRSVPPAGIATLTVFLNNTGSRLAPDAWVNVTLPAALTVVSDTAAGLNGTPIGPAGWHLRGLGNGPHSFTVAIAVDALAPGGAFLTATAHLEYTDSAGATQPSSIASATVIVSLQPKPMYLAHDAIPGGTWDRLTAAPPSGVLEDFEGDSFPGMSVGAAAPNWTLVPAFARSFWIRGGVTVDLFLDGPTGAGSTAVLNVSLFDRGRLATTAITSVATSVVVDGTDTTWELRSFDLGLSDHLVAKGNVTELRVAKISGNDLWIGYNRTDLPSRVVVSTGTYISIDRVSISDAQGPTNIFSSKDVLRVAANVSDPFGTSEIARVALNLTDPDGAATARDAALAAVVTDPNGTWALFGRSFALAAKPGSWSYLLTATEGNGVEVTSGGAFLVEYPLMNLTVTEDIPAPHVGTLVAFTIGYANIGTAAAAVAWINATLPPELTYVSDTTGGLKTGASAWTLPNVAMGPHAFILIVRVERAPENQTLFLRFDLTYADTKGFSWISPARSAELAVVVPQGPPGSVTPLPFLLLGIATAGGGAAALWVWHSRRPAIEEAFLIHRDGILLYHVSRNLAGEGDKDRDTLSAMLTALQAFVKDSFTYGEKRDLNKLEFGEYAVVFERGQDVFLAAVFPGKNESEIRRRLRRAVDEVEAKYGTELHGWGGDMERIMGVRDIVKRLVTRRQ